MVRGAVLPVAFLLAGCHQVFELTRPPPDSPADAPPDAPTACDQPGGLPDEDGDGFRNACDNCPHVAQLGPDDRLDDDSDGVGDRCDPHADAIDTLTSFVGFDDTNHGLRPLIDNGTGTWMVIGGALQATSVAQNQDLLARLDLAGGLRNVTVVAGMTLVTPHPAYPGESAGVWVNIDTMSPDPTFPRGNVLELVRSGTTRLGHLVDTTPAPAMSMDSPANNELFVQGRRYELTLTCQGTTTPTCTGTVVYQPGSETVTISLPAAQVRDGAVGLRAYATDVAFHYLAVYRHGP